MTVAYARPHVKLECIANCGNPDKIIVKIHWEKSGVWHKCQQTYGNTPELQIGVDILNDILSLPPSKFSGKGQKLRYNPADRFFYWKNQKLVSVCVSPDMAIRIKEFILGSILQQI